MLLVEQNAMMPEIKIRLCTCISVASRFLIYFFAVSVGLGLRENLSNQWQKSENASWYVCKNLVSSVCLFLRAEF